MDTIGKNKKLGRVNRLFYLYIRGAYHPTSFFIFFLSLVFLGFCKMSDAPRIKGVLPLASGTGSGSGTPSTYTIGGTVTLLGTGKNIVLQNNAGSDLTLSTNGSYTFSSAVADNTSYAISILTQPINQTCVLTNSTGTISAANVANADVTCSVGTLSSGTILNPLTLTGGVTTLNGSPCADNTAGCSGISGYTDSTAASSVRFDGGQGVTTDGTNLYVADRSNNRIRKVVIATGATTTLAGNGTNARVDGTGTAASLSLPRFITTDGTFIYLSDTTNDCIRKIHLTTIVVSTIVTDNSLLSDPRGIVYYENKLYVVDNFANAVRQIDLSTNAVTTVISTGLSSPRNITLIGTDLYIADSGFDRIAKTTIGTWTLATFAGSTQGYSDNAVGTSAQFRNLEGITTDGNDIYAADTGNHNIRKVTVPGQS